VTYHLRDIRGQMAKIGVREDKHCSPEALFASALHFEIPKDTATKRSEALCETCRLSRRSAAPSPRYLQCPRTQSKRQRITADTTKRILASRLPDNNLSSLYTPNLRAFSAWVNTSVVRLTRFVFIFVYHSPLHGSNNIRNVRNIYKQTKCKSTVNEQQET